MHLHTFFNIVAHILKKIKQLFGNFGGIYVNIL